MTDSPAVPPHDSDDARSAALTSSCHVPVMAVEVVQWLRPAPGMQVADGTLGGGGHTRLLATRVAPTGGVLAVDRDVRALERAERELAGLPVRIAQANFCELPDVMREAGITSLDGILLDLGLSSDQLADDDRGFSFHAEGPLDLRFDVSRGKPAWQLMQRLSEQHLADLIFHYGEERFSRRIARAICARRHESPIQSARELADLVRGCIPAKVRHQQRIDPATRTFQALRIAVNDELKSLRLALEKLPEILSATGRLAIISFHSLEDRMVKEAFTSDPRLRVLTKKPVTPTETEIDENPRARSAKLRVACRRN